MSIPVLYQLFLAGYRAGIVNGTDLAMTEMLIGQLAGVIAAISGVGHDEILSLQAQVVSKLMEYKTSALGSNRFQFVENYFDDILSDLVLIP